MRHTVGTPEFDSTATPDDFYVEVDLLAAVIDAVVVAITLAELIDVQAWARHLVTTVSPRQQYLLQEPLFVSAVIVQVAKTLGLVEINEHCVIAHNQDDKVRAAKFNRFLRDLTSVAGEEPEGERDYLGREVWDILSASDLALGPIGDDFDFATDQEREVACAVAEAVARFICDQQEVV